MSLFVVMEANSSSLLMQDHDIDDPKKTDLTVTGLNPHRYYYFYLQARTSAGLGEAAKIKGATLLDGGDIAFHLCSVSVILCTVNIRPNVTLHQTGYLITAHLWENSCGQIYLYCINRLITLKWPVFISSSSILHQCHNFRELCQPELGAKRQAPQHRLPHPLPSVKW